MSRPGSAQSSRAQELWRSAEAIHAVAYFDRDVRRAVRAAGAPGFWPAYFGTRLAPMATDDPDIATAVLYVFSPAMVADNLPSPDDAAAWNDARKAAVTDSLRTLGDGPLQAEELWRSAGEQVRRLAHHLDPTDRPLFDAHVRQPWPDDPHLALWHGVTLIREHRGDGHIQELVSASLSGCEAMLLALLWRDHIDGVDEILVNDRGWSHSEVAEAYEALQDRGFVTPDRVLTEAGQQARAAIEDGTDARALPDGTPLDLVDEVIETLRPLRGPALGLMPRSNPIGIAGGQR